MLVGNRYKYYVGYRSKTFNMNAETETLYTPHFKQNKYKFNNTAAGFVRNRAVFHG